MVDLQAEIISQPLQWGSWHMNLGVAFMASVAILAFIYIIGTITRNQNTINFVKLEIYELLISAVLVGFIAMLMGLMSSLVVSDFFAGAKDESGNSIESIGVYKATQDYYDKILASITGWMTANYFFAFQLDNLASATPYSRPLGVGLVAAPLAGFATPLKNILYNVQSALAISYILNAAQLFVFEFAVVGFLSWYLPIGILLRSFTPTRKFGGSLIAIGLGFLFIFPLLTILSYQIVFGTGGIVTRFDGITGTLVNNLANDSQSLMRDKFGVKGFATFVKDVLVEPFLDVIGAVQKVVGFLLTVAFFIPLSVVGVAFGVGYLLPAINVLVLVQAVRTMGKTFGEDIDITALTRLL